MFESLKSALAVVAIGSLANACTVHETVGSGVARTEQRPVARYDQIDTRGIHVRAVVDESAAGTTLDLTGDDNIVGHVRTRVEGSRLVADLDDPDLELDTRIPLEIVVRTPRLASVHASLGARVDVTLTSAGRLAVSGKSGASITAHGRVAGLDADLLGGSGLYARELIAHDVVLDAVGSSEAYVCATGKLDVELAGDSDATYYCHPSDIDREVSGGSSLERAD